MLFHLSADDPRKCRGGHLTNAVSSPPTIPEPEENASFSWNAGRKMVAAVWTTTKILLNLSSIVSSIVVCILGASAVSAATKILLNLS